MTRISFQIFLTIGIVIAVCSAWSSTIRDSRSFLNRNESNSNYLGSNSNGKPAVNSYVRHFSPYDNAYNKYPPYKSEDKNASQKQEIFPEERTALFRLYTRPLVPPPPPPPSPPPSPPPENKPEAAKPKPPYGGPPELDSYPSNEDSHEYGTYPEQYPHPEYEKPYPVIETFPQYGGVKPDDVITPEYKDNEYVPHDYKPYQQENAYGYSAPGVPESDEYSVQGFPGSYEYPVLEEDRQDRQAAMAAPTTAKPTTMKPTTPEPDGIDTVQMSIIGFNVVGLVAMWILIIWWNAWDTWDVLLGDNFNYHSKQLNQPPLPSFLSGYHPVERLSGVLSSLVNKIDLVNLGFNFAGVPKKECQNEKVCRVSKYLHETPLVNELMPNSRLSEMDVFKNYKSAIEAGSKPDNCQEIFNQCKEDTNHEKVLIKDT